MDIHECFILPQLLIGAYATNLAKSLFAEDEKYKKMSISNLRYRYMYGASKDMLETFEMLGWVCPIIVTNPDFAQLLTPDDTADSEKCSSGLVHYSSRKGSKFMSNILGIVYLLMLWLSKGEKLKAKLDTFDPASKTTEPFVDKSGNLLPKDVLPQYKYCWF